MAQSTGKKSTGSRSAAGSRNASGNRAAANRRTTANTRKMQDTGERAPLPPERIREIYLYVYLAITVFLICGTYGVCGVFGKAVSGFFFGLFGKTFYVLPIAAFIAIAFLLANGPKKKLIWTISWCAVLFLLFGFILQLIAGTEGMTAKVLYQLGYKNHKGGGFIFGGILVMIAKVIGKAGAIIVTILLFAISIIQITGISLLHLFKNLFSFDFRDVENYEQTYEDEYKKNREKTGRERRQAKRAASDAYDLPLPAAGEVPERPILDNIVVYEQDPTIPEEKPKRKKTARPNKKVHNEEMVELTPPDLDLQSPIPNVAWAPTQTPEQDEAETVDSTAETPFASATKKPQRIDVRPKDFFDLKPDSRTYADPLGDETGVSSTDLLVHDDLFNEDLPEIDEPVYKTPDFLKKSQQQAADKGKRPGSDVKYTTPVSVKKAEEAPAYVDDDIPEEAPQTEEKVTAKDKAQASAEVSKEISEKKEVPKKPYVFPPVKLLSMGKGGSSLKNDAAVRDTAIKLKQTLESFGVNVTITNYSCGPRVTRYEIQPEQGVKVSRIVNLADDIKLNLAAAEIRIEAPIPGKAAIGIEVPNSESQSVCFRDLIDNDVFRKFKSGLAFAVGKDIGGQLIITDISKMPHLLIAGSTGSGKSVCINTIVMSILYKSAPEDVRMIMVDPKMVELAAYNGIPHLLIPVVTDPKKAAGALNWAVVEMTRRYKQFAEYNVRNIQGFNQKVEELGEDPEKCFRKLPRILVIVDELADLMMVAHNEVEDSIVRLSQLARAAGIHLVIATQRPSVDVITGLIKANVPSRIAFKVSSGVDSRTILDMVGAEKLLGNGDMLFAPAGTPKPIRVQGAFVSDEEVVAVTDYIKKHCGDATYDDSVSSSIDNASASGGSAGGSAGGAAVEEEEKYDEYFEDAGRLVIEKEKASIGYLQRVFRIGFNRAARIMDQLAEAGVVGPEVGTKPREILMTINEFEEMMQL